MSALNTLNTGIIAPSTAASYNSSATGGTLSGYGPANTNSNSFTNTTTSSSGGYPSLSNYSVPAPPSGVHPTLPFSSSTGVAFPSISHEHSVGDSAQSLFGEEYQVSSSSPATIDRSVLPRGKKAPAKLPQVVPSAVGKAPMPPPRKTLSSQSLFQMARADSTDLVTLESPTVPAPPSASTVSTPASFAPVGATAGLVGFNQQQLPQHQQYIQHQQQLQQRFIDGKVSQQPQQHQQHGKDVLQDARRIGGGDQKSTTVAFGDAVAPVTSTALHQPDDAGSTDSSIFDEDVKKRPRKLFSFGKRFAKSKKQQ
ncbi:uncharacterized protein LOC118511860 [Anopheles stephensi]|nr:uncharacterized protein LOC118511860 [Anopheles stephensi]